MALFTQVHPDRETGAWPVGTFCFINGCYHARDYQSDPVYFVESFTGLVLEDREKNMPDDSDWYVNVWNEKDGCVDQHFYATTRCGGTDHNFAKCDASDDIRAKAAAWAKAQIEKMRRAEAAAQLKTDRRMADDTGLGVDIIVKLRTIYPDTDELGACVDLLRTRKNNRFRSAFRKSLAEQLFAWLHDKAPKFERPFSPRQLECLVYRPF